MVQDPNFCAGIRAKGNISDNVNSNVHLRALSDIIIEETCGVVTSRTSFPSEIMLFGMGICSTNKAGSVGITV